MNQVELVILTFDNSKLVTSSYLLFCLGKINMEADPMNSAVKVEKALKTNQATLGFPTFLLTSGSHKCEQISQSLMKNNL